jgi:hypothetical protein
VEAAKKQLLLLDAEAEGARIRAAAVTEAAQGVATSTSRQQAALEEQRAALGELLRQLEAREDGVAAAEADLEGLRAALGAQQVGGGGHRRWRGRAGCGGLSRGGPHGWQLQRAAHYHHAEARMFCVCLVAMCLCCVV